MQSNQNTTVIWQWECPDCYHFNPREAKDVRVREWCGTTQCASCKRRYELSTLYRMGFASTREVIPVDLGEESFERGPIRIRGPFKMRR